MHTLTKTAPLKPLWPSQMGLVFKMAMPLLLVSLLYILIQFSNTYALGHSSFRALYLISLYIPVSFFLMAISDSVSLTNQVLVAKKVGENKAQETLQVTANLSLVGVALFLLLAGISYLGSAKLGAFFSVRPESAGRFASFVTLMFLTQALMLPGMLLDSAIRGLGKVNIAFLLLLFHTALYISLLAVFVSRYQLEERAIVYASALCAVVLLMTSTFALYRLRAFSFPSSIVRFSPQTIVFLRWVGLPIFLSYLLIFTSTFFYNHIVAPFGEVAVAGFGIAYRIHTLVILPALALGEGISILINQNLGARRFERAYETLQGGLWGCIFLYAAIAAGMYFFNDPIVGLFTENPEIREQAVRFLSTISFSYLWLGVLLTLLIVLQQTDNGFRAFLLNLFYFALIVVVGAVLTSRFHSLVWFYRTFAACNTMGLVAIFMELRRQRSKYQALISGLGSNS